MTRRQMAVSGAALLLLTVALPSIAAAAAGRPSPPPFGGPGATSHRAAVAPYTFENTILRIHFDFERGILYGHETVVVRPKHAGLRVLPFHSLGIAYERVLLDGRPIAYELDPARQCVLVRLPTPAAPAATLTVDFTYSTRPEAGVYFVRPDTAYPHITPQIWSQGEPQDNRRWFPTWDEPNEKTPSELIVTVSRGWTVVANGYLKSHVRGTSLETWDWNAPRPKAPYLIAFVAGPLARHHTTLGAVRGEDVVHFGTSSMDVDSFVPPPYAALNATCLGNTNAIVAYFQRLIGARFPWEKYDQATAERYFFGGMEDTSATILTTRALHPRIEDVEQPCDVLVAHELAQQWYGDDASWADFSDVWLGEGFATYFDELWSAKRFGEAQFEYERYQAQRAYFAETLAYARPIVDAVYADPIQVFDASSHQRPAQVLHMLRTVFGDARFFAALRAYYLRYSGHTATTHDFFASMDRSLGTNLAWFEEEWFHRTGVPHYVVRQRYDAGTKTLTLGIDQHNADGRPFRMPVTIEADAGGRIVRARPVIDRNAQTVVIAGVPSRPRMVLFDPNATILRRLTFPKSVGDLAYQLAHARYVGDREWALGELANLADTHGTSRTTALRAVRAAALGDPFYGVRADAASAAGAFADGATVDAALHDGDPRVRLAAAAAANPALAAFPAITRDLERMSNDPDARQAAAALEALGTLRAPEAYASLVAALDRPSFDQEVASGALLGLAAYGDAAALPFLEARTAYGVAESERNNAIVALVELAAATHSSAHVLPELVKIATSDPLIGARIAATGALGVLGDPAAIPALEHIARSDSQKLVQLIAEDAAQTIGAAATQPAGRPGS